MSYPCCAFHSHQRVDPRFTEKENHTWGNMFPVGLRKVITFIGVKTLGHLIPGKVTFYLFGPVPFDLIFKTLFILINSDSS